MLLFVTTLLPVYLQNYEDFQKIRKKLLIFVLYMYNFPPILISFPLQDKGGRTLLKMLQNGLRPIGASTKLRVIYIFFLKSANLYLSLGTHLQLEKKYLFFNVSVVLTPTFNVWVFKQKLTILFVGLVGYKCVPSFVKIG